MLCVSVSAMMLLVEGRPDRKKTMLHTLKGFLQEHLEKENWLRDVHLKNAVKTDLGQCICLSASHYPCTTRVTSKCS